MKVTKALLAAFVLSTILVPHTVLAQGVFDSVISSVGGALPGLGGFTGPSSGGFVAIAYTIMLAVRPLIFVAASLVLTLTAFRMVIAQEENSLEQAKKTIGGCIGGIVLVFLIEPFIAAFYGTRGEVAKNPSMGVPIVTEEVLGIINWALTLAAVLAVVMIITTAVKAVAQANKEDGIANMRKTIYAIAAGIILILGKELLAVGIGATGHPTPAPFIQIIVNVLNVVLSFMALAAVIVVVYAGVMMVLDFGRDEEISKSKALIIRSLTGLVVILISYALVNFVIAAGLG
jgi:hypothetical protein